MSIVSAAECIEYGRLKGVMWGGTEDDVDWPRGCYHSKNPQGQGGFRIWFNTNVNTVVTCDRDRVVACLCKGK